MLDLYNGSKRMWSDDRGSLLVRSLIGLLSILLITNVVLIFSIYLIDLAIVTPGLEKRMERLIKDMPRESRTIEHFNEILPTTLWTKSGRFILILVTVAVISTSWIIICKNIHAANLYVKLILGILLFLFTIGFWSDKFIAYIIGIGISEYYIRKKKIIPHINP